MPTTSPDNLWSPDNSDNFEDLVPDLATMQGSVQAALSSRAIRTYKWADTAARNAQTGMSEGDIGYQLDIDTLYVYTGAAWGAFWPEPSSGLGNLVTAASGYTISQQSFSLKGGVVFYHVRATKSTNWATNFNTIGSIAPATWYPSTDTYTPSLFTNLGSGTTWINPNNGAITVYTPGTSFSGASAVNLYGSYIPQGL